MKLTRLLMQFGVVAAILTSCSPDNPDLKSSELTSGDLVEGVAFSITPDISNPNIIHLKSLLPSSYQVAWETPQGCAVSSEYTLKIAFTGDYEIRMGVDTKGGYVWSMPAKFHIDEFCTDFVDHFLWNRLSGGVGQSKTWQLDLGVLADGKAKTSFWNGPHWFWNVNFGWDKLHSKAETETTYANYVDSTPWDSADAIDPTPAEADALGGGENWYWAADYAGNSWMCTLADYGYITFDLINGAHVTITDAAGNLLGKGTYVLDVDAHTLSFSDVYPLSSEQLSGSRTFKLLYLSDTAMQLINDGYNKSINYVTKDYFDSYVPDAPSEPTLPDGWREDITQISSTSLTWTISPETPLNWCTMTGDFMNDWKQPSDYPDWLGTVEPSLYAGFSLTMDINDNTARFVMPDGSVVNTTFTLDNKGIFTFDGVIPSFAVIGWANFALDASNSLRVMSIEKDEAGKTTGMWLGAKSSEKEEYLAYHFILKH